MANRDQEGESALQMKDEQQALIPQKSLDESILCLRVRFWWFLTLFLQCFLLILMITCLSTPKWVKQGDYLYQWEGGVVTCTTCESLVCQGCGSFDNKAYSDLKEDGDCRVSDIASSFCSAFEDLSAAGGVYFFFEMLSIAMLGVWVTQVAFLLMAKECCVKMRWLGYLFPSLAVLFHLLGLIIWAGISEAKFDGDCKNSSFDGSKPTLCATNGPALAVVTVLIYAIAAGAFLFALIKSAPTTEKKNPTEESKEQHQPMRLSGTPLQNEPQMWQAGSPTNANFAGFHPESNPSPRQAGGFGPYQGDPESGAQGPSSDFRLDNQV